MREEEGGRRDKERGIFDRAIDLGLGSSWGWRSRRADEQASVTGGLGTCSAAALPGPGIGGGETGRLGTVLMVALAAGSPSSPNVVPHPVEPVKPASQTAALSGAGPGVPVFPGIVSFAHRKNWSRRRDETLLPTSLVVQLTGSVGTGRNQGR